MKHNGPCIFAAFVIACFTIPCLARAAAASPAPAAVMIDPASPRVSLLKQIHLLVAPVDAIPAALDPSRYHLAIIDGTPANLTALQQHAKDLDRFTHAGGWVMLWGVTPEGLATFDQLVGVDHVMRPFGMEKVAIAASPSPLSAGIVSSDLAIQSEKWTHGPAPAPLLADDAWSNVVDLQDIAPFCQLPPPAYWGSPDAAVGSDRWPGNMVNGIDDYWRFSFTIPTTEPRYTDWTMKLPKTESIDGFSIERETLFSRITQVRLSFPGTDAKPVDLHVTQDTRQDFSFPPVKSDSVEISLQTDGKRKGLTGIRNLWLHIARPADYAARVRPLASIGVLVAYLRGGGETGGGIVLNEMNVPEHESLPENAEKKQAILNALLRNLHAPFDPAVPVPMRKVEWLQKGTAWEDPANWSVDQVPGKTDIACFPAAHNSVATVNPVISKPAEVGGVIFDDDYGAPGLTRGHELAPGVKAMLQNSPSWIIDGADTLSVGAAGISVVGHRGSDIIHCDLNLAGAQTWRIGDGAWAPNVLIRDQYGNSFNLVLTGTLTGTGAWTKEGTGRVYYANNTPPTFTGGLTVRGAAVEWALTKLTTGGSYQFGPGPITLDGGSFCFGANDTPTKNTIEIGNSIFVTPKNGMLEISAEKMLSVAPPLVRYTGPVHLAGNLKLAHSTAGWGVSGLDIVGPLALDQSAPRTLGLAIGDFVTGWNVFPILRGDIHDEPVPTAHAGARVGNPLVLRSLINSFLIVGTHSDYAEDTYIDTCGSRLFSGSTDAVVVAGPGAALGKGNILLQPGGHLTLTDPANLSPGKSLTLESDPASQSVLGVGYNGVPAIAPDSAGVLAIDSKEFDAITDLSKIGNGSMRLGSFHGGRFVGTTLTPGAGNVYRLGGGGGNPFRNTGLLAITGPVLTGSAGVEVGSTAWWGNGVVRLGGANTFTGPLVVQSPAPPGEYEINFVSCLAGITQPRPGASPFGSPTGPVLLDNAMLRLEGTRDGQPVVKGTLTAAGHSEVFVSRSKLTFADVARQGRSVLSVEGSTAKSPADRPQFHVSNWKHPLAVTDPCILWGNDFASYDPAAGLQPFAHYVSDLAKASSDDVLRLGATVLAGQAVRVKDLKTTGPITGKGTFTLGGGGLIATGDFHPDLDFGNAEGIIYGPCNLFGKISGKNGLTITESMAGGRLMIELLNAANDFLGPVTVDNAVILVRFDTQDAAGKDIPGSLGDLHNDIYLNGGFINRYKSGPQTELAVTRTLTLGPGGGGFFFAYQTPSETHIRARITGPGMLTQFVEDRPGLIIDNPDNDYSGGTKVCAGENVGMTVGPLGKLGIGPVLVDPESQLVLQGDRNIDPHARLEVALGGIVRCTSSHPALGSLTGAGTVYLDDKAGTALAVGSDNSNFTFLGSIIEEASAPGSLTKTGSGVWTLYGAQHYRGLTTVAAGTLDLHGSIPGDLAVASAATLANRGQIGGDLVFQPHSILEVADGDTGLAVGGKVILSPTAVIRIDPHAQATRWKILTDDHGMSSQLPAAPKGYRLQFEMNHCDLYLVKQ